jgi:meso-butanediol dehydrogenase/(S,S)-butanediol dehydrogenase/diacetyl reductase
LAQGPISFLLKQSAPIIFVMGCGSSGEISAPGKDEMPMRLQGKTAYVTGGGNGIGRGIALVLAREGADLLIADIDGAAAQRVAGEIRTLGRQALAMRVDVTRAEDAAAMIEAASRFLGGLDIAVNAAGVISVEPVEAMPEAAWDRIMDINAKGVFLCCRAAIPALKRRGSGRIINIASVSGKDGHPGLAHYSASKYAVIGFTNSLAKELARDEITVNAICPGVVQTAMWDVLCDEWKQAGETPAQTWQRQLAAFVPQGRPQTPEDIGELAVYLALAPNMTGQAINLDGGLTSH